MRKIITLFTFIFFFVAQSIAQDKLNLDPVTDSRFKVTDKVWPVKVGEADVCLWNDDKLAAFTVTIDDNIEADIPFWKTMIKKYGFNLTWFVITEADEQYNVNNWQLFNDMAALGSQINGHDDRNWYSSDPPDDWTNPTPEDYLARLQRTQDKVNAEVTSGNNRCLTYAYPFGDGNADEARKIFTAIRGVKGLLNLADKVNYLEVNSITNTAIDKDAASMDFYMLPLLDKTSTLWNQNYYRGWGSTHYHGVADAASQTKVDAFFQYLQEKDLWIDGFSRVSQYAQSYATHNLVIDDVAANEIKFTLTDEMKDDVYNTPLTVKVRIDNNWTDVTATQNGADVEFELITNDENQYALVKVVPDQGQVILTGTGGSDPTWDYTLKAPAEDGYVSDPAVITTNNPYLWGEMKLGKSAVDGSANTTSAIIPFILPARPEGKAVTDASLKVYVSYGREYVNANVDLYGLPFVAENDTEIGKTIYAADHYAGPFADTQGDRGAAGIEDDYFTKNVAQGELDTPRWEETAANNQKLIDYINEQYDAGAQEGDWIFLRLSMDNDDMTGSQYFKIEGGDSEVTDTDGNLTAATLNLSFSGTAGTDPVEKGALGIYPNPVIDGTLRVSLQGFSGDAQLKIYSVTGRLIKIDTLKISSGNYYETPIDLSPGMYIVKLHDGLKSKTQKLIVQ